MSANFTPSQTAIADLRPFRMWCQKVLPAIYDESLSYYEVLCKVVTYLNETMGDVNTLNENVTNIYNAYVLLQSYVNDYFDEEFPQLVEDKLDEMVEDGTFTALFEAIINPLFNAKSDEIDARLDTELDEFKADINDTLDAKIDEVDEVIDNATDVVTEYDTNITLLESRMEAFVSNHAGLVGEETIWEGSSPLRYENTTITLDNPVSDYVFIDIYYKNRGRRSVQRFSVDDVLNAEGFYLRDAETTVPPGDTPQMYPWFRIMQMKLVHNTVSDASTLTLVENSNAQWDGSFSISPTVAVESEYCVITKIVGVNNVQSDSEVVDARVGADGTIYPNLEARLNAENNELKSQIQQSSGLTEDVKQALMDFANAVAFKSDNPTGQTYIDALESALYPPANLVSISAVYTQSGDVYEGASLDSLRADLVVTALYDDTTTATVSDYTLSGTLTVGTSTITVTYGGKTATFNVTVTVRPPLYTITSPIIKGGGTGIYSQEQSGYHYIASSSTRLMYPLFDILLEGGKTYRFVATSSEANAQMALQAFNENVLNYVNSNSNFGDSDVYQPGWGELDVTLTLPETHNGSPMAGTRLTFRKDSSNGTISTVFISKIEIYEV